MSIRRFSSLLAAILASAILHGCSGSDPAAAIRQNLSDAEVRIDRFDPVEGSYLLRGRIVSVAPVGGAAAMAEAGQDITLSPWYPGDRPDPSDPDHSRLMTLPNIPPGSVIRCRIALDSAGAWRIVSVN